MPYYIDQTGFRVEIPDRPTRIVSLVPSQTELLSDLELGEQTIGITKFCIHPGHWFKTKERVGGTKNLNFNKIHSLRPDLIIANKEENLKVEVEELRRYYPVWVTEVKGLETALDMIRNIGLITDRLQKAEWLAANIQQQFARLSEIPASFDLKLKAAYLIWQDPYMVAGNDTFINDMMNRCHFENVFNTMPRYPVITLDDIRNSACNLVLLSSEPYPFNSTHCDTLRKQLPQTKTLLVDGEMFSWYGSHLLRAPGYFSNLIKEIHL